MYPDPVWQKSISMYPWFSVTEINFGVHMIQRVYIKIVFCCAGSRVHWNYFFATLNQFTLDYSSIISLKLHKTIRIPVTNDQNPEKISACGGPSGPAPPSLPAYAKLTFSFPRPKWGSTVYLANSAQEVWGADLQAYWPEALSGHPAQNETRST